jgi:hypothetical protein
MTKSNPTPAAAAREQPHGGDPFERLRRDTLGRLHRFRQGPVTPQAAYALERELKAAFDEAARALLEEAFNRLEPDDPQQADPKVRYHRQVYRINKKTKAEVATCFGPVTLWSFLYLCAEDGEPGLHPLHVRLGIQAGGATAVLAERVARWAVEHGQQEVRRLLQSEHGLTWSNDRLRRVLREFRRAAVAFRAEAQAQRLRQWLGEAERSRGRHRPVLAVGRDGVMVPIRGSGYQEASAATVSVYDRRGKRLGTVYLGQMPEAHQAALTAELTALVTAVLGRWAGPPPRLVYVTDKGQAQDDYYRRVLRRLKDPRRPGRRLSWEWVLDFFHVCGYLGKLREALFGGRGYRWFERMRRWLRDRRQGVSNVLRSAVQHSHRRKLSKAARREFGKAYRYLRRHSRWMDYGRYRRLGLPLGSGVTEAACKTVFTQRLKRSGMRWHKESGQVIVDLRVLYLSGVWDEVVRKDLQSRALPERVERVSSQPPKRKTPEKAA